MYIFLYLYFVSLYIPYIYFFQLFFNLCRRIIFSVHLENCKMDRIEE